MVCLHVGGVGCDVAAEIVDGGLDGCLVAAEAAHVSGEALVGIVQILLYSRFLGVQLADAVGVHVRLVGRLHLGDDVVQCGLDGLEGAQCIGLAHVVLVVFGKGHLLLDVLQCLCLAVDDALLSCGVVAGLVGDVLILGSVQQTVLQCADFLVKELFIDGCHFLRDAFCLSLPLLGIAGIDAECRVTCQFRLDGVECGLHIVAGYIVVIVVVSLVEGSLGSSDSRACIDHGFVALGVLLGFLLQIVQCRFVGGELVNKILLVLFRSSVGAVDLGIDIFVGVTVLASQVAVVHGIAQFLQRSQCLSLLDICDGRSDASGPVLGGEQCLVKSLHVIGCLGVVDVLQHAVDGAVDGRHLCIGEILVGCAERFHLSLRCVDVLGVLIDAGNDIGIGVVLDLLDESRLQALELADECLKLGLVALLGVKVSGRYGGAILVVGSLLIAIGCLLERVEEVNQCVVLRLSLLDGRLHLLALQVVVAVHIVGHALVSLRGSLVSLGDVVIDGLVVLGHLGVVVHLVRALLQIVVDFAAQGGVLAVGRSGAVVLTVVVVSLHLIAQRGDIVVVATQGGQLVFLNGRCVGGFLELGDGFGESVPRLLVRLLVVAGQCQVILLGIEVFEVGLSLGCHALDVPLDGGNLVAIARNLGSGDVRVGLDVCLQFVEVEGVLASLGRAGE